MFETLQRLLRLSSFKADQAVHNCTTRVTNRDDGHEENGAFDDLPVLRQHFRPPGHRDESTQSDSMGRSRRNC